MTKATFLSVLLAPALLLAGAPIANAQVYTTYTTPSYTGTGVYTNACVTLTAPMTIGSSDYLNGGQVTQLQSFLSRSGLLSSLYVTGYYGSLTASAVAQFQATHNISPVGVVGPATRAAIQQASCGGTSTVTTTPTQLIYPTYPSGSYNSGYPYGIELDSFSSNTYSTGIVITLKGYGFDSVNNTVHFDGIAVSGVASSNGTQLSFTVPMVAVTGTYPIYVSNSHGTSNTLSYIVTNDNAYNTCSSYNNYQCNCSSSTVYNNDYNYNNNYNDNCNNYSGNIHVNSLSQTSAGYSGMSVTVSGYGFTNYNTVYFGSNAISNVYSNGTSLTFSVPSVSSNYGTYSVYVTNSNGQSSNSIQFTINGGSNNNSQVYISYLSPSQGSVGTQIAIQGNGFTSYGNTVHFGNGGAMNLQSYNNGGTIYFTVPSSISPCSVTASGGICAQYLQIVSTGQYPVYVTNQNGNSSNTVYFQVN
ncbi:MAG: peptidoglycan-binding protein [Candidatus Pacebacteria bacterium]|nr:peptidoglycan-binding protein [Candidatus Paceibacterota bacterium]